jgi:hypothetical protein
MPPYEEERRLGSVRKERKENTKGWLGRRV